jgi:integrase/recombinase XerD
MITDTAVTSWPRSEIERFLDYLTVECGLTNNTVITYRRNLKRFACYCLERGHDNPRQITPITLQQYAQRLHGESLVTASIAQHLVTIRMFLRFHLLSGLVDNDITSVMETPKTWRLLPRVLGRQKTAELILAVDPEDNLYLRDRALLELLYATGLRASEAANLIIADINFQVGYLRCLGKGNRERIVPIYERALESLRQYMEGLRCELLNGKADAKTMKYLFLSRTGKRLSRVEIWRIVRKVALRAGLMGRVTPHTLRHCFGTHLLAGGADLRSVQEMLGHVDVSTTQIYTHVDQEHLRRVHKKYHPMG